MLLDNLEHAGHWPLGAVWTETSAEIRRLAARGAELAEGQYPLPHGAKASVQVYVSREPDRACYESHQIMADVQIVLDGEEYMNVIDAGNLAPDSEYDSESDGNDVKFYREAPEPTARVLLRPGVFALLLPGEAHMPCLAVERPSPVKKLVAKIPASLLPGAAARAAGN